MGKLIRAVVNPLLLVWAREKAGYSIEHLSSILHENPETVSEWEKGTLYPTITQLRKLGKICRRPIAVFYLPERPEDFEPIKDFRRFPSKYPISESPRIAVEVRKAYEKRETAIDLYDILEEKPINFIEKANFREDPDVLGIRIRKIIGLDSIDLHRIKNSHEMLNFLRNSLESIGFLIMQATDIEPFEARGFSIAQFPLPTIVMNIKESPTARIFTVVHELVHIMLNQSSICDLCESESHITNEQQIEIFCNRVAGSVLVPKNNLLNHDIVANMTDIEAWSDNEIDILAKNFKVSRETIVRRLLICGKTTEQFYRSKREQYQQIFEEEQKKKKKGFLSPSTKSVSGNGFHFTELVLTNYKAERINSKDVSEFLGIRIKHLPQIEKSIVRNYDFWRKFSEV